jgi:hypothetical protein
VVDLEEEEAEDEVAEEETETTKIGKILNKGEVKYK